MLAGAVVGMISVAAAAHWLRRPRGCRFEALRGASARTALIIVAVMTVHSIAEGVGVGVRHAALWSVFSSLPQPVLALPAFLFVEAFSPALPAGLGFAAGAMLWMVVAEIAPEAFRGSHEGIAFR
jgi:ZIP family zinc transporter